MVLLFLRRNMTQRWWNTSRTLDRGSLVCFAAITWQFYFWSHPKPNTKCMCIVYVSHYTWLRRLRQTEKQNIPEVFLSVHWRTSVESVSKERKKSDQENFICCKLHYCSSECHVMITLKPWSTETILLPSQGSLLIFGALNLRDFRSIVNLSKDFLNHPSSSIRRGLWDEKIEHRTAKRDDK